MKRYNVLDLDENLVKANLTMEEAMKFIGISTSYLLEEINEE